MKQLSLFLAALMSLSLFTALASAEPIQPSMSAARIAARAVGWEVARRNQSVQSVTVDSCRKKGRGRIHCLVLDRGSTSISKTTCRVSVRVEAVAGLAKGTLRGVSCRNKRLLLLRASDAEAAMQAKTQELPGHEEFVSIHLARLSRVELVGFAGWATEGSGQGPQGELCSARLHATLTDDGVIQVTTEESGCTKIPPDA